MKVLILDNYDSFTYNLVHIVEKILHQKVDVYRNDQIQLEHVDEYQRIILSPGPGIPSEAGILIPLIRQYADSKSILGVCLGHQAIAEAFGGSLINLETVFHGVSTPVTIIGNDDDPANIFKDMPRIFDAGRYHSWIVDDKELPVGLQVTARDENGFIMAMRHTTLDVQGVQFHPESVLTPLGEKIISNWLSESK